MTLNKEQEQAVIQAVRDELASWDIMVNDLISELLHREFWQETMDGHFYVAARSLAKQTIIKELPDFLDPEI